MVIRRFNNGELSNVAGGAFIDCNEEGIYLNLTGKKDMRAYANYMAAQNITEPGTFREEWIDEYK